MINIFAKRAFLNTSPNTTFESKKDYHGRGHLQRVSSMIRADQIADYLNARLNPTDIGMNDTNIFVKPHVSGGNEFNFPEGNNYIDIIDGWGLLPLLEKHPEVGVIACSVQDEQLLKRVLPNNKVVCIPQHNANYDREVRTRTEITTMGIIGTEDAFKHIPEGLEEQLGNRGITLLKYSKFFCRQDIIDFYKQIDLQLIWRPYRMRLSNPLKIVNASSFGIPTLAYEESVFKEVEDCYIGVKKVEHLLDVIDVMLADNKLYTTLAEQAHRKSEDYHISTIAAMYKQL